ncbi:hypothetical protein RRF57_006649 [Xylaria bambusicola]|uniref:Secreted protein n=1 Tax=Xylaria bambusicola TaxID=326684 RepID=A0AAN7UZL6_9PEZI
MWNVECGMWSLARTSPIVIVAAALAGWPPSQPQLKRPWVLTGERLIKVGKTEPDDPGCDYHVRKKLLSATQERVHEPKSSNEDEGIHGRHR